MARIGRSYPARPLHSKPPLLVFPPPPPPVIQLLLIKAVLVGKPVGWTATVYGITPPTWTARIGS